MQRLAYVLIDEIERLEDDMAENSQGKQSGQRALNFAPLPVRGFSASFAVRAGVDPDPLRR
ncbi:MAG: hypothetical protein J6V96_02110 [Aeriscardovia sp.]|nr:hypothetical protein [Aeriscardovia sp.]